MGMGSKGSKTLHGAVEAGDLASVQRHLRRKTSAAEAAQWTAANATKDGLLHVAIRHRQPVALQALLAHAGRAFDLNRPNAKGRTPLCLAVWKRDPECLAVLLDAGADPDGPTHGQLHVALLAMIVVRSALAKCKECRSLDRLSCESLLAATRCLAQLMERGCAWVQALAGAHGEFEHMLFDVVTIPLAPPGFGLWHNRRGPHRVAPDAYAEAQRLLVRCLCLRLLLFFLGVNIDLFDVRLTQRASGRPHLHGTMAARATTLLASALLWTGRAGHGAMLIPGPPRNAIDGKSHPWSGEVPSG